MAAYATCVPDAPTMLSKTFGCAISVTRHIVRQSVQGAISLAVFGAIALVCVWVFSGQSGMTARDRIPQAKSSSTTPTNQSAVANFVRTNEPPRQLPTPTIPKNNVTDVQTRLISWATLAGRQTVFGVQSHELH
jgi:hypothetical protein